MFFGTWVRGWKRGGELERGVWGDGRWEKGSCEKIPAGIHHTPRHFHVPQLQAAVK